MTGDASSDGYEECFVLRAEADGSWNWSVLDHEAQVLRSGHSASRLLAEYQARKSITGTVRRDAGGA